MLLISRCPTHILQRIRVLYIPLTLATLPRLVIARVGRGSGRAGGGPWGGPGAGGRAGGRAWPHGAPGRRQIARVPSSWGGFICDSVLRWHSLKHRFQSTVMLHESPATGSADQRIFLPLRVGPVTFRTNNVLRSPGADGGVSTGVPGITIVVPRGPGPPRAGPTPPQIPGFMVTCSPRNGQEDALAC